MGVGGISKIGFDQKDTGFERFIPILDDPENLRKNIAWEKSYVFLFHTCNDFAQTVWSKKEMDNYNIIERLRGMVPFS